MYQTKQVSKQLQKLDVNKASGPDGIPALVLRNAAAELASPLARLYQLCFNKEYMPAQWKVANVIPCFKKGDKHSLSNYRPISLLSVLSKVMEKLINKSMWKHLENHKLISDRQLALEQVTPPLMPSHTLLNVSPIPSTTGKKLGSCVWTSAKHLIEYGIRVSWLNYVPLALLANCSTGWQTT